jgi:hypothetical protein
MRYFTFQVVTCGLRQTRSSRSRAPGKAWMPLKIDDGVLSDEVSLFTRVRASARDSLQEFVWFHAATIAVDHVRLIDGAKAAAKEDQTIVI